jgi:hypothetical protein
MKSRFVVKSLKVVSKTKMTHWDALEMVSSCLDLVTEEGWKDEVLPGKA